MQRDGKKAIKGDEISMIQWTYNPADFKPDRFKLIPPGKYRVRIENAEETKSSTGKDMIKLTLKVSGYNSTIWHYVVFEMSSPEGIARTNNRLGWIYDSFNIPPGNLDMEIWKNKAGRQKLKTNPTIRENSGQ